MKKIAILITFVLVFTLCGCGGEKTNNSIELTLDNYSDYLKIYVSHDVSGDAIKIEGFSSPFYDQVITYAVAEGVSSNFNYEDVEIVLEPTVEYSSSSRYHALKGTESFTETITLNCDVAGNASETVSTSLKGYTYASSIESHTTIVSISGKVTPVR